MREAVGRAISLEQIGELLLGARAIAVVGCSPRPERDSHRVAAYLKGHGYRIIPVNPGHDRLLGERCFPSLDSIPRDVKIDIVDVFRRPEYVSEIVDAALLRRQVRALWLQLGCSNPAAQERAAANGIMVVAERCIMVDHARLVAKRWY